MAITRLDIQTTQQTIPRGAPFNADSYNDLSEALSTDLANLALQWNNSLQPLLDLMPDGSQDTLVNAYGAGLDGRTFYVDASADTTVAKIRYYNVTRQRPKTLKEMLDDLFSIVPNTGIPGPKGDRGVAGPTGPTGPSGGGGGGGGPSGFNFSEAAFYDSPHTFSPGDTRIIMFQLAFDFGQIPGTGDISWYLSNEVKPTSVGQYLDFGVFILAPTTIVDPLDLWNTTFPDFEILTTTAANGVWAGWDDAGTIARPTGEKQIIIACRSYTPDMYGGISQDFTWRSTLLKMG